MNHKTKINYFSHAGFICFFLCSTLFIGCSAPEKRYKKERLTLVYRQQSSFDAEIKKLRLEHPIKISAEQTTNHLLSLHYEELSLLGKKKYIFSSNDVLEIASLITKALNRIKPNKILHYEIETSSGKTKGTIFRVKRNINWRFETINGINFSNTGFSGFKGSSWQLLPNNGQLFHKEHTVLGNDQKKNWIIANLDLPVQSKRGLNLGLFKKISKKSPAPQSPKQKLPTNLPISEKGEFEKRLQFLKGLRDKKLIDDDEYKNKKIELLSQFP